MCPSGVDSILAQTLGFWLLLRDRVTEFLVASWITPKLPGLSFKDPLAGFSTVPFTVVYRCSLIPETFWYFLAKPSYANLSNKARSLALPWFLVRSLS